MTNISINLDKYIKNIVDRSNLNRTTTERVINTQLALLFGDLAVTGESDCFLGKLTYDNGEIFLEPNNFIKEVIKGKIDPVIILKEIFENV